MGQALTCAPSVWADYEDMQQSLLDEQPSHCEVEPSRVLRRHVGRTWVGSAGNAGPKNTSETTDYCAKVSKLVHTTIITCVQSKCTFVNANEKFTDTGLAFSSARLVYPLPVIVPAIMLAPHTYNVHT